MSKAKRERVSETRLIELYVEVTGLGETQARSVLMHLTSEEFRAERAGGWPAVILSERAGARRRAQAALGAERKPGLQSRLRAAGEVLALGLGRYFSGRRGVGTLRIAKG